MEIETSFCLDAYCTIFIDIKFKLLRARVRNVLLLDVDYYSRE